jgi:hypothetical protein
MKTKIAQNYLIQEDRGVLLRTGGPGTIIVTSDDEPEPVEIDSFEETARHIGKLRLKPIEQLRVRSQSGEVGNIEQLRVRSQSGEVDNEATEAAIQSHYTDHYAVLEGLAVDWAVGMKCKRGQAEPVRYDGKLYNVNITHTVVDPNHTPDIVENLYTEIPAPAGSGYPVWYQPIGSTNAWAEGSICEWEEGTGKLWISTIPGNTTEPGTLLPWGYWEPYNDHTGL